MGPGAHTPAFNHAPPSPVGQPHSVRHQRGASRHRQTRPSHCILPEITLRDAHRRCSGEERGTLKSRGRLLGPQTKE